MNTPVQVGAKFNPLRFRIVLLPARYERRHCRPVLRRHSRSLYEAIAEILLGVILLAVFIAAPAAAAQEEKQPTDKTTVWGKTVESRIGKLDKAHDEANPKGWTVVRDKERLENEFSFCRRTICKS